MSGAAIPVVLRVPREDRFGAFVYFARRNPRMIIGGALVVMWLFLAALTMLFGLGVSGQIKLRRIDGWRKIAAVLNRHSVAA